MNWYIFGLIIYICFLLVVSFYASKKIKGSADFIVASRSLPSWLLVCVFAGLWLGGGTLIGASGAAFDFGFWSTEEQWGVIPDPYGAGLCLILGGLFYFTTIRKLGGVTLADYFTTRFGRKAGLISTIVMIFAWLFWVSSELVVIGKVLFSVLGLPYAVSVWIGLIIVIIYTVAGGLWSIAFTDLVQVGLILIGIILMLPIGLSLVGGWETVLATLPKEMFQFFPLTPANISPLRRWIPWIAGWMIIGLGSLATPDIVQTAHSGKSHRDVRIASIGAGFIYWIFGTMVVVLGMIGAALVSRGIITPDSLQGDSELILLVLAQQFFPTPIAVIFIVAIFGAVMSSIDGALLALSTLFTKNILQDYVKSDISEKRLLLYGRVAVVVFAIITALIGVNFPHVFLLMNFGFDCLLAGLFVPLTLGIYWKGANRSGFYAGITTGIFLRVVLSGIIEGWGFETVMYPENWYIYTIIAPLANLVAMVTVSIASRRKKQPIK